MKKVKNIELLIFIYIDKNKISLDKKRIFEIIILN